MVAAKQSIPAVVSTQPVRSYAKRNQELAAAFERWIIARGLSKNTRSAYTETAAHFLEFFGAADVATLDRSAIGTFLADLYRRGLTPNSFNRHVFGLRGFYRFLRLAGVTGSDPMRFVPYKKIPHRLPRVLSEEEVTRLIEAAETPRDRAMVEVLYASACRVSELTHMLLEDVDFDTGRILIRRGKGNRDRYVLFGSKAHQALKDYLATYKPSSGFLFETPPGRGGVTMNGKRSWQGMYYSGKTVRWIFIGRIEHFPTRESAREQLAKILATRPDFKPRPARPLTPHGVRQILARMAARAGIGHVHPHALRRAAATHLLNRGMNIRYVQEILGHELITTTQLYTHQAISDLQRTYAKCHPHAKGDDHAKE